MSPGNFPHKGQWRGALMFSLICVWVNGWVNNREAGDLRRHGAHYDVIVMISRQGIDLVFQEYSSSSTIRVNWAMVDVAAAANSNKIWYGNPFRVACPSWNESTGRFPSQRTSNVDFWCFLCCLVEQAAEPTFHLALIWGTAMLRGRHLSMTRSWKDWSIAAKHYGDVIMDAMASQITSLTIVYSTVYSGADQRKYQSSASLAFVRGIHRWPVNSPHRGQVTRKMFPFDDVIMTDHQQVINNFKNKEIYPPKYFTNGTAMIKTGGSWDRCFIFKNTISPFGQLKWLGELTGEYQYEIEKTRSLLNKYSIKSIPFGTTL